MQTLRFKFAVAGMAAVTAVMLAAAPASAVSGSQTQTARSLAGAARPMGPGCAAVARGGTEACTALPGRHRAAGSGMPLARAPRALQTAVHTTLGTDAPQATSNPQASLQDPGGLENDFFGDAVAISGNTAVVGAPGLGTSSGVAYVYARSGTKWNLETKTGLTDGTAGGNFGSAVAIEGNTIVVGAYFATVSGATNPDAGAAFVFTGSGSSWTQVAELSPAGGPQYGEFGAAVAIDPNTLTIVVGAPGQTLSDGPAGVAYVFSGANWAQQVQLPYSDPRGDAGATVAISEDAGQLTIAVGDQQASSFNGAVAIFTGSGVSWTLATTLPGQSSAGFGSSVALQGETLVVGADGMNNETGEVYVYIGAGSSWFQEAAEPNPAGTLARLDFGVSVALSSDATTFVAGDSSGDASITADQAYVFSDLAGAWTQTAEYTDPVGQRYDFYGQSTAISPPYVAAGAPGVNNSSGTAYIYDLDTVTLTNPGKQSGIVGGKVSLQVRGSSSEGYALTWTMPKAPPGLHISKTSGLISGKLSKKGTFTTKVTATDSTGASASVTFTWSVT